jgi:hypothetical protein
MEIRLENGNKLLEIDEVDETERIYFFYDTERTGDTTARSFFLTKQEAMKIIDFLIIQTNEK